MLQFVPILARMLMAAIFILSGIQKIQDPAGTRAYMTSHGMPLPGLFLIGAIVVELAGGLSILLGFQASFGALLVALYLVPTTIIFHTQWSDPIQQVMLMKNLAIIGGLLLLVYFGPGPYSLDYRLFEPR